MCLCRQRKHTTIWQWKPKHKHTCILEQYISRLCVCGFAFASKIISYTTVNTCIFFLTHTHTFSYFFFLFVFSTSFILILCHTLITSSLLEIFHMISNLIRLNSSIISSTYTMSALFPFFFSTREITTQLWDFFEDILFKIFELNQWDASCLSA